MHQLHHELLAYILDQYKASLFLEVRINKENMQIPWWTERQNSFHHICYISVTPENKHVSQFNIDYLYLNYYWWSTWSDAEEAPVCWLHYT